MICLQKQGSPNSHIWGYDKKMIILQIIYELYKEGGYSNILDDQQSKQGNQI